MMPIQAFEEFPRLQQEQLFRIRDDLGDEFPRFLTLFSQHSQHLLEEIHKSLDSNDLEQIKMSLHSFRGMCGSMGAARVFHLCKHAEAMASTAPSALPHIITHIETELLALDTAIQQILQTV
jgi:HPt (histidine-containing phosphotransfer) domain-containing protein